jgi:hypothetical protein
MAERRRNRNGATWMGSHTPSIKVEGFHILRQRLRNNEGGVGFCCPLILSKFGELAVAPILGAFEFPQDDSG